MDEEKIQVHKFSVEDKKLNVELEENKWKSCCFQIHSESSLFFAKVSISLLTVGFCGYQLITL